MRLPRPPAVRRAVPPPPAAAPLDRVEAWIRTAWSPPWRRPAGPPRGRPRILPAPALWGGLAVCVLRGWASQREVWRLLAADRPVALHPLVPVTDEAVYRRLAGADPSRDRAPLRRPERGSWSRRWPAPPRPTLAPFATEVVALDETALDPVARTLPALRAAAGRRRPRSCRASWPGSSTCAASSGARSTTWPSRTRTRRSPPATWWPRCPAGSLLLFDLGYFAFAWFDDLTARRLPLGQPPPRQDQLRGPPRLPRATATPSTPWSGWGPTAPTAPSYAVRLGPVPPGRTRSTATSPTSPTRGLPAAGGDRPPVRPPLGHRDGRQRWPRPTSASTCSGRPSRRSILHQVWAVLADRPGPPGAAGAGRGRRPGSTRSTSRCRCWSATCPRYAAPRPRPARRLRRRRPPPRLHPPRPPVRRPRPDRSAAHLRPPPADLPTARPPRYARRRCGLVGRWI